MNKYVYIYLYHITFLVQLFSDSIKQNSSFLRHKISSFNRDTINLHNHFKIPQIAVRKMLRIPKKNCLFKRAKF